MNNPWLEIPASDYEGHMGSPDVGQLQMLARIFSDSVGKYDSDSLALLGCATGNGLDALKDSDTALVTAIDINPEYLSILRERYEGVVKGLEIVEADLEICDLEEYAYNLVFAGLLFEYVQPVSLLARIARWLRPGGVLVCVLQMGSVPEKKVTETSYESLKLLEPSMNLVRPCQFRAMACEAGFSELETSSETLDSGKSFFVGIYRTAE